MNEDPPVASGQILRASVVSAVGTGVSRVLGALRDVAIGHVFGAGRASDVFWMAWTVPSVFRRFVADEGLTGALIPAVAHAEQDEGVDEARRLARGALAALLGAGVVLCAAGILAAPWLVQAFAFGFAREPGKLDLTVQLTRWLFPFVLFVSLVSYCEGLLNCRGHFLVPKLAPGLVSACMAVSALLFATRLEEPVFALAAGALAGGLVHLLVCIPPLWSRWGVLLPSLRAMRGDRFGALVGEMGKVVVIGIVAQLNVVLLRLLASLLEEGSVTHYWYANRVVDLAQGAIAVAVSSALLPVIARDAAEANWDALRQHFHEAVRLAYLMLMPAAVLVVVLARPVVSLLFVHGAFDVAAANRTIATLQLMVPFMLALAGINIIKKVFFVLDDRTTLLVVGTLGLSLTGVLGYVLSGEMGVEGLGLTLSISVSVQLLVYLVVLQRRAHVGLGGLVVPLGKLLVASTPVGVAAWGISQMGQWNDGPANLLNWVWLAAAGAAAAAVYAIVCLALGVQEIRAVLGHLGWKRT